MSIETKITDPQELADGEAVLRHAFHWGEPLDLEVARRENGVSSSTG